MNEWMNTFILTRCPRQPKLISTRGVCELEKKNITEVTEITIEYNYTMT